MYSSFALHGSLGDSFSAIFLTRHAFLSPSHQIISLISFKTWQDLLIATSSIPRKLLSSISVVFFFCSLLFRTSSLSFCHVLCRVLHTLLQSFHDIFLCHGPCQPEDCNLSKKGTCLPSLMLLRASTTAIWVW